MTYSLSGLYQMYRDAPEGETLSQRVTERVFRLPNDLGLILESGTPNHPVKFRPVLLVETLSQYGDDEESGYSIEVTGPVQTRNGNDHKTQRESMIWYLAESDDWERIPERLLEFISTEAELGGPWPLRRLESWTGQSVKDNATMTLVRRPAPEAPEVATPANHSSTARTAPRGWDVIEPGPDQLRTRNAVVDLDTGQAIPLTPEGRGPAVVEP